MTKRRDIVENGNDKQRIEYAEIYKTIKKKARENIRKYNYEIIRETIMTEESQKNEVARPRQTDHTIDKQGRESKIKT